MDAVKSFNNELSSLYEVKPPISKAKMTSLTRGAIKAIKFYKHVVQSVEKFILKCKPEYKVPGLYVIDSIVRQSRHQFGPERDVFASRFSKNMQQTFINLFKCPAEDKSKVIRVLNLWQKNQVFPPEVIQPLFDLTDPNHPMYKEQMLGQSNGLSMQNSSGNNKGSPALQRTPKGASQVAHQTDAHLSGITNNPGSITDQNTLAQLQQLQKLLQKQGVDGGKGEGQPVRFDRKLLEFDYDDEEDDDHVNPSPKLPSNNNNSAIETVGSLLSNPEVLRQLQTLQQTMTQAQAQQHQEMDIDTLRKLQEMKQQEEEFDKHLAQTVPKLPFASECDFKAPIINNSPAVLSNYYNMTGVQDMTIPPPGYKQPYDMPSQQDEATVDSEIQFVGGNDSLDLEVINLDHVDSISQSPQDERYSNRRRRSRSGDRSRDSRVRDRDRRSRRSRTRSRSRDRRRRSRSRVRDKEREREKEREKEKEKERCKRGLPPVKKDNLSVCSTTLWVGHLSKLVHQEELSDTFGEFGDVVSIDLIPPRGCAFICMHRRQDASRCLQKLKSHKMQGKAITLAWAPGKGVKGKDLKDYWEVDLGVSYIPWAKLKPDIDMELLEEGGMIDEETMPSWLKTKQQQLMASQLIPPPQPPMIPPEIVQVVSSVTAPTMTTSIDTSQPPPMSSGLLQPPPLTLPLVSSFQLGNRLLGAVGMNLPHGMMSNIPIGVPPPNMPGAMLSNQLLGMGSPFGHHQGPPGLLPPPLPMQTPDKIPTTIPDNMGSRPDSLLGLPFGMISQPQISISLSHEDNMDVEMEDASDRMDKQPPLSDQLLAALGQQNNETSLSAAVSRLHAVTNQRSNSIIMDSGSDGGDRRGERNDRSRDRDRDHRNVRRNSRERNKDRDRDRDSRDRRDDRRDRTNRWGDRDRDDHGDRKERNEKSLNDRLREMAHQGSYKERRSVDNDFNSRDSLPPPFHPPFNDRDDSQELRINHEDRFRHGPPHDDSRVRRRSDNWEEPEFEPPPPFINRNDNGPPRPHMNRDDRPPLRHHFNRSEGGSHRPPLLDHEDIFMEDNRFRRNEDFMDEPIHDNYEPPMREGPMRDGPGFGGSGMAGSGMGFRPGMGPRPPIMGPRPMMGPGPRMGPSGPRLGPRPDFWGPPRPMRLHGPPDGFHPRGRMPNPHKFLPRGGPPPMRGLRPPGPPMRHNFQPRFDGPPDHFASHSGPPGPPGIFDDIPPPRERRDNRRQFPQQDYNGEEEHNGRDRRSTRWGNSAPEDDENEGISSEHNEKIDNPPGDDIESEDLGVASQESENVVMEQQGGDGNSTPLHDEPQDHAIEKDEPQQVTEMEGATDSAEAVAE